MSKHKAILVAGARPNFMKVKPVLDALERRNVDCRLVHTGQHYDPKLSQVFFDELGIRPADTQKPKASPPRKFDSSATS